MAEKIDAEVTRIREMLVRALEENRFSVRSVERKLGATVGAKRKVLRGQSPLTVRHLLEMLDVIGLPWETFFHSLYPPPGQEAPPLGQTVALGPRGPGSGVEAPAEARSAPSALDVEEQRAERVLRRVFARMLDELLKDGQD
jgi:transcriptional regulator with XRE-family HTH domain